MNTIENEKILAIEDVMELLQELLETEALELCYNLGDEQNGQPAANEIMIPYVMNDALECYLHFSGCLVRGPLSENTEQIEQIAWTKGSREGRHGLIFRQSDGTVGTIWYDTAKLITQCYQYHLIGHDWRTAAGEEDLRRLVNLVCVLHDKRRYGGDACISEREQLIADLAEFPPMIYFSPIDSEILEWYPQTEGGIRAANALFAEAEDETLLKELSRYEKNVEKHKKASKEEIAAFAALLLQPEHRKIWELLSTRITEASLAYPARSWGECTDRKVQEKRTRILEKYRKQGFEGQYPFLFYKHETDADMGRRICFAEQQPFTVMEAEDFRYKIFSMQYMKENGPCIWTEEDAWYIERGI